MGLEFPYVFMTGMEEELFPHSNALYADRPEPEIEEERRLCYVGMTRAKTKLYMTYAYARRLYNRSGYTMPSRFLKEIPDEYKEEIGGAPSRRESTIMDFSAFTGVQTPHKDTVFITGDMVNHRSFGLGVIVDVQGEGKSAYITIDFQEFGKKTLVQEYARLIKV
jgi:DNA helicase-2/ATP-dependent DNA helicase PcrA